MILTERAAAAARTPIRGWLIVYLVALALLAAHGLALTIASLILAADPSLAGLTTFVPASSLAVYVMSNLALIVYTVVLFVLMARKRRSAMAHAAFLNALSAVFLLVWHVLEMKSTVGVAIDLIPPVVMTAYILTSRRARETFRT